MSIEKHSIKEQEALRWIMKSIMNRGKTPSVRELMASLGYRSPRSVSLILTKLKSQGYLKREEDGSLRLVKGLKEAADHARTVEVPLLGCAPCGLPFLADSNVEAMLSVSIRLAKPPHQYFLVRATGDSMTEAGIRDSDMVLVRQQETANEGDIVVALVDDEATIKEFHYTNNVVALKPRSKNKKHKPIIVTREFQIQGVVVATISNQT